jgi:hypothetical protein
MYDDVLVVLKRIRRELELAPEIEGIPDFYRPIWDGIDECYQDLATLTDDLNQAKED